MKSGKEKMETKATWAETLAAVKCLVAEKRFTNSSAACAYTYAEAGQEMAEYSEEQRVQALYILSNLSGVRGSEAKAVRAAVKAWSEVKERKGVPNYVMEAPARLNVQMVGNDVTVAVKPDYNAARNRRVADELAKN